MGALELYKHLSKKSKIKGVDLRRYILDIKEHELEDFENEEFELFIFDENIDFKAAQDFKNKG